MKIFGLTLVKNEQDIIRQSMTAALEWCDRIGVVDNGSTDGTYEILQELATEYPDRFELCGVRDVPFDNDLRRIPFNALRPEAEAGDWWCRLDADEFYPVDPRSFLQDEVEAHEYVVWSIHLQYYYTDEDYQRWQSGNETLDDRDRPIQKRRRYYRSDSSEARFFRHRKRLVWDEDCAWPYHLGPVAKNRIPVQHFLYRDPEQIKQRLQTRREAFEEGHHRWGNNNPESWTEKIEESSALHYDSHDGDFVIEDELLPNHLESLPRRVIKRIFHGIGVWP